MADVSSFSIRIPISREKLVSSTIGMSGCCSRISFDRWKTSISPTLNILITKSNPGSSRNNSSASTDELTRRNDGGLLRFRSMYSLLICTSIRPSSSSVNAS